MNTTSISEKPLCLKAGADAWRINPQTTKPTSTSTGVQAAEILES